MFLILFCFATAAAISNLREFTDRGSCDTESIPYKISVSGKGNPDLFCASPLCLGDDYTKGDRRPSRVHNKDFTVTCEGYRETVCNGEEQWTGGFMEFSNGTHVTLKTKCCNYPGLKHAQPVRTIVLNHDEEFSGGAYNTGEKLGGFDLIKEVKKKVDRSGVKYEITIVRIPCQFYEGDDYEGEESQFLSRNKRRLGYQPMDKDSYYGFPARYGRRPAFARSAPLFRRGYGHRRRQNLRRLLEDYYYDDYDNEVYQPRRRFENLRTNRVRTGNVLWPIAYESPKGKQFGAENTETEPIYTNAEEPQVVETQNTLEAPKMVYVASNPAPNKMIVQMPYITDNAYQKSETGPLPPPDTSIIMQQQTVQQGTANTDTYQAPVPPPPPQGPVPPPVDTYQIPQIQQNSYAVPQNSYVAPPAPNSYPTAPVQQDLPAPQPVQQQVYQPAYQPAYQPSYPAYPSYPSYTGGGLNGAFGNMQCFSGKVEVETTKGKKKMEDLQVGDLVMTIDESMITFSPVIMFLHNLPYEEAEFLKIVTSSNTLELTEQHLIYISPCNRPQENARLMAAKEVVPGDCVSILVEGKGLVSSNVTRIDKVKRRGIYAPLTSTGDIFADGMLASCHSNLGVKTLQQTFFSTYKGLSSFFKKYLPADTLSYGHDLPNGVSYLTSVLDLFVPHSYF